jgi:hypothetical protein
MAKLKLVRLVTLALLVLVIITDVNQQVQSPQENKYFAEN